MFNWIRNLGRKAQPLHQPPAPPHVVPKHTSEPGLVPTLDQLPVHEEVAVNRADDIIYRNVEGTIVKYTRADPQ